VADRSSAASSPRLSTHAFPLIRGSCCGSARRKLLGLLPQRDDGRSQTPRSRRRRTQARTAFAENCSTCHGATGHGGNGGPDLRTEPLAKTQSGAEEQVNNGGGGMPAFKGELSEEEIKNVAAYVVEDIVGGK
jgi:mono/diheme cytochrome c family protein